MVVDASFPYNAMTCGETRLDFTSTGPPSGFRLPLRTVAERRVSSSQSPVTNDPECHTMLDTMKKALYTGLGAAVLTKDKLEEMGREMIRQANLSEQEGRQFLDELNATAEQAKSDLEARIENTVETVLTRMNLATHHQVESLTQRMSALENANLRIDALLARVEALEARVNQPQG